MIYDDTFYLVWVMINDYYLWILYFAICDTPAGQNGNLFEGNGGNSKLLAFVCNKGQQKSRETTRETRRNVRDVIFQQINIRPMMLSDPSAPGEKTTFFLRCRSFLIEAPKWNLRRKNLKTGYSVIKYFSRKGEFVPIFSCFAFTLSVVKLTYCK